MKIAYIYDVIYPYVKGGAEKRIYEISKRLAERGHDVHLFGMKFWQGDDVIENEGVYLHGVCKSMKLYVDGRRSIWEAAYFALKLLPKLMKERFDVIDCQEFPYLPCFTAKVHSMTTGSALVITWLEVWGNYWYDYLGKMGLFGKTIEKFTTKLTNLNIAISNTTKRNLEKIGLNHVEVIPCGVNIHEIRRIKKSGYDSDVIFAGRLIKDKNVDVLIRAVNLVKEEIPHVKCFIIGDGPERAKLEKLTHNLGIDENIKFLGFLENHNDVISHMKASKVFVLPSTREGFGIAALEANACGLPVITIDHEKNASKDFIENGVNGFVCRLSEKEIAEKIFFSLENGSIMEKKCLENSMKYDWNRITDIVEVFYKGVKK